MNFIDLFSGVGGFTRGMELAGHECAGHCEFDKYAEASYRSMHTIIDKQREHLMTLPLKQRQKEILKDEYLNGEWYANDIRRVIADDIPRADCWCFGFPCQDISIAGKQRGFKGNRSSLFFRVTGLLRDLKEKDRPNTLFIENVRNILSVNRGFDFARLLVELDEIGYDAEWQVINSKHHGVPQNRERVFIVGHLRGRGRREVFPIEGTGGENRICQVGQYALNVKRKNPSAFRIFDTTGISPCLTTSGGGGHEPHIIQPFGIDKSCNKPRNNINAIWSDKYQRYLAIRKLTPRECFRLQGWTDDYFEKAEQLNSNSQLYKQAGNGVTVTVIKHIAKRMKT